MFEEDDVALEVFRIFYVIVSFHSVIVVNHFFASVGQLIGGVYHVVVLSKVPSELFIFFCGLFGIPNASVC